VAAMHKLTVAMSYSVTDVELLNWGGSFNWVSVWLLQATCKTQQFHRCLWKPRNPWPDILKQLHIYWKINVVHV